MKFDVERRNLQNEIDQLHQTIAGNKLEIAKLYDLIDTRRLESENLVQEVNLQWYNKMLNSVVDWNKRRNCQEYQIL